MDIGEFGIPYQLAKEGVPWHLQWDNQLTSYRHWFSCVKARINTVKNSLGIDSDQVNISVLTHLQPSTSGCTLFRFGLIIR